MLSLGAVFLAKAAEGVDAPLIRSGSIEALLTVLSSIMLAVATFAVASTVSAYASASTTPPRARSRGSPTTSASTRSSASSARSSTA